MSLYWWRQQNVKTVITYNLIFRKDLSELIVNKESEIGKPNKSFTDNLMYIKCNYNGKTHVIVEINVTSIGEMTNLNNIERFFEKVSSKIGQQIYTLKKNAKSGNNKCDELNRNYDEV